MPLEPRPHRQRNVLIVRLIAAIVILVGLLVMYGWIAGIPLLTSLNPSWVSMKFVTAICFVLSGVLLWLISTLLKSTSNTALTTLPIVAFVMLLLMGGLVPTIITGAGFGIETFFVQDPSHANFTSVGGVPALATIVCFVALGSVALFITYRPAHTHQYCTRAGIIVAALGSIVCVGYATDMPILQSYVKGVSSAMALHTAILFVLIGIGLLLLSREFPVGTAMKSRTS